MSKNRLPHFIIIGAMKSATTTLQEQLERQPGIFMCDPKEPNFFGDDEHYQKGLEWYGALFLHAPEGAILGEASTHYTKLPTYPRAIERMRQHLPNARLLYLMRHPIDRLVSHYIHEWSMGTVNCGIDEAVKRHPEMIAYGKYALQLSSIFKTYERNAVLPVFFDRLTSASQSELERVCRFIGYRRTPTWISDLKPGNVSSDRIRKFPFYDTVIETPIAARLRRAFIPKRWRNWVRSQLTMKNRPELSHSVRSALEAEFDLDLERLGRWLGRELTCSNFKQVTAASELNWVPHGGRQ